MVIDINKFTSNAFKNIQHTPSLTMNVIEMKLY